MIAAPSVGSLTCKRIIGPTCSVSDGVHLMAWNRVYTASSFHNLAQRRPRCRPSCRCLLTVYMIGQNKSLSRVTIEHLLQKNRADKYLFGFVLHTRLIFCAAPVTALPASSMAVSHPLQSAGALFSSSCSSSAVDVASTIISIGHIRCKSQTFSRKQHSDNCVTGCKPFVYPCTPCRLADEIIKLMETSKTDLGTCFLRWCHQCFSSRVFPRIKYNEKKAKRIFNTLLCKLLAYVRHIIWFFTEKLIFARCLIVFLNWAKTMKRRRNIVVGTMSTMFSTLMGETRAASALLKKGKLWKADRIRQCSVVDVRVGDVLFDGVTRQN